MLENGRISSRQIATLLFMAMISTSILFVPAFTVDKLGSDAWIALLLGTFLGLLTLLIANWLGQQHPQKTIFQYSQTILGSFFGKILAFMYVWNFLRVVAVVVREFGEFMTTAFMPNTPIFVFIASLLLLAALAAIAGIEVLARTSEFIILLVATSLVAIVILSLGNWELNQLLPMFTSDLLSILKTAATIEVWKADAILAAMLIPFMIRPQKALVAGAKATLAAGILITIGVIGALAIFGPYLLPSFRFPIHMYTRTINIGRILTRFEALLMVIWVAGVFVKTSVYLYFASLGLAQAAGLKEYKFLVLPLGVICATWSISLFENVAALEAMISNPYPESLLMYLGVPLFLMLITIIRNFLSGQQWRQKQP